MNVGVKNLEKDISILKKQIEEKNSLLKSMNFEGKKDSNNMQIVQNDLDKLLYHYYKKLSEDARKA